MTNERSWKPDVQTLASWGSRQDWPHRYFGWLQGPQPLPELPPADQVNGAFTPLLDVLQRVYALDARRLADFQTGKFRTLSMAEDYDYRYEDERIDEEKKAVEYRQIIRDLMTGTFPAEDVTDDLVEMYVRRLEAKRPYGGPTA